MVRTRALERLPLHTGPAAALSGFSSPNFPRSFEGDMRAMSRMLVS